MTRFGGGARRGAAGVLSLVLSGCVLGTGPQGPFAQVAGTWAYVGDQSTPALQLTGTLEISTQDADLMLGSLSFQESDGLGGTRQDGGAVTGRVIGLDDVDFDVLLPSGDRRHVGRISANGDTLRGIWTQPSTGSSGEFRATRGTP